MTGSDLVKAVQAFKGKVQVRTVQAVSTMRTVLTVQPKIAPAPRAMTAGGGDGNIIMFEGVYPGPIGSDRKARGYQLRQFVFERSF